MDRWVDSGVVEEAADSEGWDVRALPYCDITASSARDVEGVGVQSCTELSTP